ncbi:hypothetical protein [Endozoicomonas ascidiicola]|nr:hypothetical protein [Endozoicomonas ascidiicola]
MDIYRIGVLSENVWADLSLVSPSIFGQCLRAITGILATHCY